jgi:hypothetical protein
MHIARLFWRGQVDVKRRGKHPDAAGTRHARVQAPCGPPVPPMDRRRRRTAHLPVPRHPKAYVSSRGVRRSSGARRAAVPPAVRLVAQIGAALHHASSSRRRANWVGANRLYMPQRIEVIRAPFPRIADSVEQWMFPDARAACGDPCAHAGGHEPATY